MIVEKKSDIRQHDWASTRTRGTNVRVINTCLLAGVLPQCAHLVSHIRAKLAPVIDRCGIFRMPFPGRATLQITDSSLKKYFRAMEINSGTGSRNRQFGLPLRLSITIAQLRRPATHSRHAIRTLVVRQQRQKISLRWGGGGHRHGIQKAGANIRKP